MLCTSSDLLRSCTGLLRACSCLLRTGTMLRSLLQTTRQKVLKHVQKVLQPSPQQFMLHGSGAMLCSSTSELLCPSTLLRFVVSQTRMINESKAGDIRLRPFSCADLNFIRRAERRKPSGTLRSTRKETADRFRANASHAASPRNSFQNELDAE